MTQRLPLSLTPLHVALAALTRSLASVAPVELPLHEALGCVAAEMPPLGGYPPQDIAAVDGWALRANDLVGASSYSPLPLAAAPAWVNAGDSMPAGCDCVLDLDAVEMSGPFYEVLMEGLPGQGVRRAGSDTESGSMIVTGRPVRATDLVLARMAGLSALPVRRPRLCILNIPGATTSARLIVDLADAAGAEVAEREAGARDAASIAGALDTAACDLLLTIGGSGVGRHDATIAALAERGEVFAHGIALQPGRTAALGRIGRVPVIALPGSPDHVLAAWLALALPVVDHLSARRRRRSVTLPLAQKIASSVGVGEIALLAEDSGTWQPLAVGELSLKAIARADAWLLVADDCEGFAAGTPVDAYLMRE
jgi:molybdopterin biosynthesis enzyme